MGRRALAAAILVVLAPGPDAFAAPQRGGAHVRARASAQRAPRPPARRPHVRPPALADAKAAMTALMRDRERRRFRHQWERAIAGLLRAGRGKDAAAAHLEASRARYALYRWSANEADREAALKLAARAAALGSAEAPALARAIRREAGEERPSPPPRRRGPAAPPVRPAPAEEDSPADPALEAALAELGPSAAPALSLGDSGGEGKARISEIRTWASEDYTRVAVYLSHWVGWHKLELPSAPGRPRRVALDFRPALLTGATLARPVGGEQVDRVRAAQNDPETVRVVLELPGVDGVQVFALDDPPRLVLDIGGSRRGAPVVAGESTTTSTSTTSAHPERSAAEGGAESKGTATHSGSASGEDSEEPSGPIRRIVVDAGHGGHDPGAIGPRRVREKDVTLAMAKRLARKLRAAGFEVVLTRADDRFLALEERTAVANTARGDLFVSIHANAHPQRNRSGVETYFLNVADDRYAARLAARENGMDLGDGETEVTRILTDLDAKASASASRQLARLVQREVTAGVRARVGEVRDLGVKSALFYVLLGARMPAVLVETAFISNRDEERRLASVRYQDEVAGGVARAVSTFARRGDRVAAAR
jgi:N-acetylmuramoyl-L-alanine amidase